MYACISLAKKIFIRVVRVFIAPEAETEDEHYYHSAGMRRRFPTGVFPGNFRRENSDGRLIRVGGKGKTRGA